MQPVVPPGQAKHRDPSPAGYGRGAPFEDRGAAGPAPAGPQATGPHPAYGASREVRPSGVNASDHRHRFGGSTLEAPRAAEVGAGRPTERVDRTVVSAVDRNDVARAVGPGGLPEETSERDAPVAGYFAERTGKVLEPLRGTAVALLGWTEQVTGSVVKRTAQLLENVLPRGGHGKHGPLERAPPLPPGSGSSGSAFSGAGAGEGGAGPLLAVLSLLIILASAGRFWPPYEQAKPRLIPRPVSERPG